MFDKKFKWVSRFLLALVVITAGHLAVEMWNHSKAYIYAFIHYMVAASILMMWMIWYHFWRDSDK